MFDAGDIPVFAASFTAVAACLFLRRFKQSGVKDDGKRYPPSLPLLPFVGAILRGGMTALPEYFMKSAEKLGPVFSFGMGKSKVVVLNGYEAIYDAMVRHSEAFADRPSLWTEETIMNPDQRGIGFLHYNEAYKRYRKVCLSILKEFGYGDHRVSETRILQEVESMNDAIVKENGRPFDPKWLTTFSASKFILSILFGKNFLKTFPKNYSSIVEGATECMTQMDMTLNMAPLVRFLPMYRKMIHIMRTSSDKLLNGIEDGIQFNKSNSSESSFVERFLEIEGADYNHQDLLYILRDMCFASTGTVSTTIQWAMVELANHPDIQNRFQREIDEVVPEDRFPSLDDKPRLPYTDAVILEIMRRRTVAPFFDPHATLRDTNVLGYDIPKGSMVMPNGYSAHMDQKFWKDPENFRPERFLDDNMDIRRVIAFGLGKRSCLAEILGRQSTFLFLTSLVQRFNIRPPEGQKTINVKEVTALTTAPSDFEVRLISRVKPSQNKD